MSKAKIQVIDRDNIGIYADFGSESEDDDWERKAIEKEDEEIRDFVKCHPLPPREDFDFWKSVVMLNGLKYLYTNNLTSSNECMKTSPIKI
jgi:hypothetical protein